MSNNTRASDALAARLCVALAIVQGAAAAIGVAMPGIFKDPPAWAGNARGTAAVILFVALPWLVLSSRRALRGSSRVRVVWLGTLGYLVYNAVIFAFGVTFNRLFPLYVAALGLSVWSLAALAVNVDPRALAAQFDDRLPARSIGAYLVAIALAFAVLWLAGIVPALRANGMPLALEGTTLPTNPVYVLDLAFALPLAALGGVWLWRRRPWGYAISGPLLVMLTIEGISVAADQTFGHVADPAQPLTAVPVFVGLTIVALVPTLAYMRHMKPESS